MVSTHKKKLEINEKLWRDWREFSTIQKELKNSKFLSVIEIYSDGAFLKFILAV